MIRRGGGVPVAAGYTTCDVVPHVDQPEQPYAGLADTQRRSRLSSVQPFLDVAGWMTESDDLVSLAEHQDEELDLRPLDQLPADVAVVGWNLVGVALRAHLPAAFDDDALVIPLGAEVAVRAHGRSLRGSFWLHGSTSATE